MKNLHLFLFLIFSSFLFLGNNDSGISTTGNPEACYSDELKNVFTACIDSNKMNPPAGNPGPFTRGYGSIVVISGQCYSGGLQDPLTSIGDNIVVGAAAAPDKCSHNYGPNNNKQMEYIKQVINQIKTNANRPIKTILDEARDNSIDAIAMTPPTATSDGGNTVMLGDPMEDLQPEKSFHALLFGGVVEANTGDFSDLSTRLRYAHNKALDDMEALLKDSLNVPQGNITKTFGGTYEDLQNSIEDIWDKMNDNEQFIMVIADHGARCCMAEGSEIEPDGNCQTTTLVTPDYMVEPEVVSPILEVNVDFSLIPGPVFFNGSVLGNINETTEPTHYEFDIPTSVIANAGEDNLIEICVPIDEAELENIIWSTGPVAAEPPPIINGIPTLSAWGLILLALLLLSFCIVSIVQQKQKAVILDNGTSVPLKTPLFDKKIFGQIVLKSIPFIIVVIALITYVEGALYTRNIIGTIISGLIISYLIHFYLLNNIADD